jgi:hypothetical protein
MLVKSHFTIFDFHFVAVITFKVYKNFNENKQNSHTTLNKYFIGIRPDYFIEVRKDILDEEDGPILLHGLKDLNRKKIILPSPNNLSPDPELLERRYEEFRWK